LQTESDRYFYVFVIRRDRSVFWCKPNTHFRSASALIRSPKLSKISSLQHFLVSFWSRFGSVWDQSDYGKTIANIRFCICVSRLRIRKNIGHFLFGSVPKPDLVLLLLLLLLRSPNTEKKETDFRYSYSRKTEPSFRCNPDYKKLFGNRVFCTSGYRKRPTLYVFAN
jgi:hypothetical protein